MEELILNSQTIPAWFVAVTMIMTGWMWGIVINRKIKIHVNYNIFVMTFILEGLMYGVVYQFLPLEIEFRGFMSRLIMVILCLSQFFPLAVACYRGANK